MFSLLQMCTRLVLGFVLAVNYTSSLAIGYDYDKVLHLSILFYEAQRSGHLPQDNRIPWRGDSALDDRGQNGEDLTGGYYDGEYLRVNECKRLFVGQFRDLIHELSLIHI